MGVENDDNDPEIAGTGSDSEATDTASDSGSDSEVADTASDPDEEEEGNVQGSSRRRRRRRRRGKTAQVRRQEALDHRDARIQEWLKNLIEKDIANEKKRSEVKDDPKAKYALPRVVVRPGKKQTEIKIRKEGQNGVVEKVYFLPLVDVRPLNPDCPPMEQVGPMRTCMPPNLRYLLDEPEGVAKTLLPGDELMRFPGWVEGSNRGEYKGVIGRKYVFRSPEGGGEKRVRVVVFPSLLGPKKRRRRPRSCSPKRKLPLTAYQKFFQDFETETVGEDRVREIGKAWREAKKSREQEIKASREAIKTFTTNYAETNAEELKNAAKARSRINGIDRVKSPSGVFLHFLNEYKEIVAYEKDKGLEAYHSYLKKAGEEMKKARARLDEKRPGQSDLERSLDVAYSASLEKARVATKERKRNAEYIDFRQKSRASTKTQARMVSPVKKAEVKKVATSEEAATQARKASPVKEAEVKKVASSEEAATQARKASPVKEAAGSEEAEVKEVATSEEAATRAHKASPVKEAAVFKEVNVGEVDALYTPPSSKSGGEKEGSLTTKLKPLTKGVGKGKRVRFANGVPAVRKKLFDIHRTPIEATLMA